MKKYLFVASCLFCAVLLTRFLVTVGFVPFFLNSIRSTLAGSRTKNLSVAQALPTSRPLFIFSSRPAVGYAEPPVRWWAVQPSGELQSIAPPTLLESEQRQSNFDVRLSPAATNIRLAYEELTNAQVSEVAAVNAQATQVIMVEHDLPDSHAGTAGVVRTVLFDLNTRQTRTIFTGATYGDCSRVVGWNEDKGLLYAVAYRPVSSETYITHFCSISLQDGTRSQVTALPNWDDRGFAQSPTVDERSGQAIFINVAGKVRAYLTDFEHGEVQSLSLPAGDWRHTLPINLREGRVLLVDDDAGAYLPLTIPDALLGEPFVPLYQNEKLPRWQFEAVSQRHSLALTQPGKQIPSDMYVIFDLTNGSVMGEFSAADMTVPGEQLRFEGVID